MLALFPAAVRELSALFSGRDKTGPTGRVGEMERESMAENEPKCHADENVR